MSITNHKMELFVNNSLLPKEYTGMCEYPPIVQDWWRKEPNYLIEYDEGVEDKSYCAIYFCSNDIWFPHTEEIFKKRCVNQNFFEWYKCRVKKACKHIFVRDVFKQWYLTGINGDINSQDKLYEWLLSKTSGYKTITIGSSAGGYAASLFGSRLKSEIIICFNAQFSLKNVASNSSPRNNPIVYSMIKECGFDADIVKFFDVNAPIFYVLSNKSEVDLWQSQFVKNHPSVYVIEFTSKKHGIPFLKVALANFINFDAGKLANLSKKKHSSVLFTISEVGLFRTIKGFVQQAVLAYRKRH